MIEEWVITGSSRGGFKFNRTEQRVVTFEVPAEPGKRHFLLIDGFLLPRKEYHHRYAHIKPDELVIELYRKYGHGFFDYIKGNFIIVIAVPGEGFSIYTDHLGIKKIFYRYAGNGGEFIFSNRIAPTMHNRETEPDTAAAAVESLMHHYIGGLTLFKGIYYSSPASRIVFDEKERKLSFQTYWECSRLLDAGINKDITPSDIAEEFKAVTRRYIDFLKPSGVSLTLTGGLDSRTILAALLNIGVKPRAFTYGHPGSPDVTTAQEVAGQCGIDYANHYVPPTAPWFARLSAEIVDKGDTITQPHRAHRLDALRMETAEHPETEMLMGGYMGGEIIRSFYYDGVIIPAFVKNWFYEKNDERNNKKNLVRSTLEERFINPDTVGIDRVLHILQQQPYFNPSVKDLKMKEFYLAFLLLAGSHHAQDLHLFSHYIKYPVAPYLDIDFLEILFKSPYNFLHGADSSAGKLRQYLKRLKGAELYCRFIHEFSPPLARIPFAKKGFYTAREYIKDPTPILAAKRAKRYLLDNRPSPVNFALNGWMTGYVTEQFNGLKNSRIYDITKAKHTLNVSPPGPYEKEWRKYTDIIWTGLILNASGGQGGFFEKPPPWTP